MDYFIGYIDKTIHSVAFRFTNFFFYLITRYNPKFSQNRTFRNHQPIHFGGSESYDSHEPLKLFFFNLRHRLFIARRFSHTSLPFFFRSQFDIVWTWVTRVPNAGEHVSIESFQKRSRNPKESFEQETFYPRYVIALHLLQFNPFNSPHTICPVHVALRWCVYRSGGFFF